MVDGMNTRRIFRSAQEAPLLCHYWSDGMVEQAPGSGRASGARFFSGSYGLKVASPTRCKRPAASFPRTPWKA